MNKQSLALIGVFAIVAIGSIAYLLVSSAPNTASPNSASSEIISSPNSNLTEPKKLPGNLPKAEKPVANVTEAKKQGLGSGLTESKNGTIIYIHTVYNDPSGKSAGGVPVSAAPLNDTKDVVYNLPGGAGVSLTQCIHQVPSGGIIEDGGRAAILPDGRKVTIPECPFRAYTTNSTGWVALYPVSNAKYYLITAGFVFGGTYGIVPIDVNKIVYITMKVPFSKTNYAVVAHSVISLQNGLLSAAPFSRGGPSAAGLHFTLLNGGSASFTVTFTPDERCLQSEAICRDSDFPLGLDLTPQMLFGLEPLPYQSVDLTGSRLRILMGAEYLPVTHPHRNLTDASIVISPNPILLGRHDRINVTVTIKAKNDASYGVYSVSFAETVKSAAGNQPEGVGWEQNCCIGLYLTISPFPVQIDSMYVNHQAGSKYLGNSNWFKLNYNGTLYAASDSGSRQVGWWEVIDNQILFTLPNMAFRGRVSENAGNPLGSSIILDDGSVWNVTKDG